MQKKLWTESSTWSWCHLKKKPLSKLAKTRPSSTWQKASVETFQLPSHLTVKEWCSPLTSEPDLGFSLSLALSIMLEGQVSSDWEGRSKVLICKWHNPLWEQVYGIDKKKSPKWTVLVNIARWWDIPALNAIGLGAVSCTHTAGSARAEHTSNQSYGPLPSSVQLLSRVLLSATPRTAAPQASLSIINSWSLPKIMSIKSVMPSNHFILCRPLLFLPSIFPSIRVFSNELALRIRYPEYWSFSFNISPSNEHSGLISLQSKGLSRVNRGAA